MKYIDIIYGKITMNLRDLKYLIAVAKHQHFTKAAAACFVSQPTLSAQLKKLEDELAVSLFEKRGKKAHLTPIGEKIVLQAQQVLQQTEQLYALANTAKDPFSGQITLGIIPTIAPYLLPLILPVLKKQLPKLQLIIHEEKTQTVLHELRTGAIDAAILALPIDDKQLTAYHLYDEPFYLAVYKQHRLAQKSFKTVSINDLNDESLLLLEEGHCLRNNIVDACSHISTNEINDFRATSLMTLTQLVANQSGITLLPKLACDKTSQVIIKPFRKPVPYRRVALLWRENAPRSICYNTVAKVIHETVKN